MKLHPTTRSDNGWSRFELLVVILLTLFIFCVLFAMLLPVREAYLRRADRINCVNNLKQLGLAYRIWENDNYQGQISFAGVTNENTMRLNPGQKAWLNFIGLSPSNELSMAKILRCPADTTPSVITDSTGNKIEISYFLSLDASEMYPQMILAGDDNLAVGDAAHVHPQPVDGLAVGEIPVKPGLLEVSSNTPIAWTGTHHGYVGNIAFADGSVQEVSISGLQQALQQTGLTTNRLAIP